MHKKTITKFILLLFIISLFIPVSQAATPTVTTNNATGVQTTNATLQGTVANGTATLTLRPNAGGTYSEFNPTVNNYDYVNDVTPDENTTKIYGPGWGIAVGNDSYNLPAHTTETQPIKSITVYFRALRQGPTVGTYWIKAGIRTGGKDYAGNQQIPTTSFVTYSQVWNTNPNTGINWTWADIDSLEIGVSAYIQTFNQPNINVTQVYVNISYNITTNNAGFQFGTTTGYGTNVISYDYTETSNIAYRPTSDISLQLIPSVGANNYACVDESVTDDADYVYTVNTAPRTDIYGMQDHTIEIGQINRVQLSVRGRRTGPATPNDIYGALNIGGTTYYSSASTLTTSFQNFQYIWNTNPNTGINWTWTDIDNLNIGFKIDISGLSNTGYCSQIYLNISISEYYGAFQTDINSLSPGQLYHYRAYANNTDGTGYGSDKTFLTKPYTPTGATATSNTSTKIYLTWTKGTGANNTRIQYKTTGYPSSISDGTNAYNGTSNHCEVSGLTPGQLYYFKAYSFTTWGGLSQWNTTGTTSAELTKPNSPTAIRYDIISIGTNYVNINISWTNGTGTNTTRLIYSNINTPTGPLDGTLAYNSTKNYTTINTTLGLPYFFKAYSFTTWTYNPTLSWYSTNGTGLYGGGNFSVYNETAPWIPLTDWTIEIKNLNGSDVYYNTSLTTMLYINASELPTGEVTIRVSKTGYRDRIAYTTITPSFIYYIRFYLPSVTNPDPYGNTTSTSLFTDTVTITSPFWTANKVIPLSYTLKTLYSVEVYNKSISSGYGGWMPVPTAYYTVNGNNTITINHLFLSSNTTYARAIYYYETTAGSYAPPTIYYCQVVENIIIGDAQTFQPVENAYVYFQRYMNNTGRYETLSILKTDAYGKVNLWLFPSNIYLITVTKTGYNDGLSDYIPSPANAYGQTELKVFSITRIGSSSWPVYDTLFTNITYTLKPTGTRHTGPFTIYYNITSYDSRLEWYRLDVYYQPYNENTWTLLYTSNQSDAGGGSISYTVANNSGRYSISCWFKKAGYDAYEIFNTGSIVHFIVLIKTTVNLIDDEAYFIVMLVIMLVGMGACAVYFSTGPATGFIGLGIMAFMLYLHNDLQVELGALDKNSDPIMISGWVIFGITFIIYLSILFLWSRQ